MDHRPYRVPASESLESRVTKLEQAVDDLHTEVESLIVTRTVNRTTGWLVLIILIAIATYEVLR